MQSMLRRLINPRVVIVHEVARDVGRVRADPMQIEQVVLNLTLNASDAMAAGGRLTFRVENADIDAAFAHELPYNVHVGRYVRLTVSDTGTGMTIEQRDRAFEPFFTTKPPGKGTGLGLATVYGIIKQSGGYIWVESEQHRGTTFRIYLPRVDAPADPVAEPGAQRPIAAASNATVLLCEDEEGVRRLAVRVLERRGFHVLEAALPGEALHIAAQHDGPIDLLVSDVVMPEMSGGELAQQVRRDRPGMRVLLTSGYTQMEAFDSDTVDLGFPFLPKPFTPETLVAKVDEVLDAPGHDTPEA
jgi:two-component system, cell cycle sensor histidine kinase and response regulator CckA